jgi:hypothetical protein
MEFNYNYLSECWGNLSVSDITATGPDQDADGFTWETPSYNFDYNFDSQEIDDLSREITNLRGSDLKTVKKREPLLLKKKALEGKKDELQRGLYNSVSKILQTVTLVVEVYRTNIFPQLVDQEVQHRFL